MLVPGGKGAPFGCTPAPGCTPPPGITPAPVSVPPGVVGVEPTVVPGAAPVVPFEGEVCVCPGVARVCPGWVWGGIGRPAAPVPLDWASRAGAPIIAARGNRSALRIANSSRKRMSERKLRTFPPRAKGRRSGCPPGGPADPGPLLAGGVAVDEIDDEPRIFRRRRGKDPVTEVEDVPGSCLSRIGEDALHPRFQDWLRQEQARRIEVSLQGHPVAGPFPRVRQRDAPVDADHVGAAAGEDAEKLAGLDAEDGHRLAFPAQRPYDPCDVRGPDPRVVV